MTGYESIMLLCAAVTTIVAIASFVLDYTRHSTKKDKTDSK